MKAIVVREYGGPEVLKLEDVPKPVPAAGEVLVKVAAASINPFDFKRRNGSVRAYAPITFPGILVRQKKSWVDSGSGNLPSE
jgi:NADPH:quinone reductase-like Zn-dependent oxidoreductase